MASRRDAGPASRRPGWQIAILVALLSVTVIGTATTDGANYAAKAQSFLTYYAGVFALVGFTATVAIGIVAMDRTILSIGQRVLAQSLHRALAILSMGFLLIHIVTVILADDVGVAAAVVPFMAPERTFYIGLGTLASDFILISWATGMVRRRFATVRRPHLWRILHCTAYACWLIGIWHGLFAGRPAKFWVTDSYLASIAGVALVVLFRIVAHMLKSSPGVPSTVEAMPEPPRNHVLGDALVDLDAEEFLATLRAAPGETVRTGMYR